MKNPPVSYDWWIFSKSRTDLFHSLQELLCFFNCGIILHVFDTRWSDLQILRELHALRCTRDTDDRHTVNISAKLQFFMI